MNLEDNPTHSDIHYRLGQVSGKVESLQSSLQGLDHDNELLSAKITGIDGKVTMLFTGVMIAAFLMPIVVPIAGHYIEAAFGDNATTTKQRTTYAQDNSTSKP